MPAIGPNTRRAFIALAAAAGLRGADDPPTLALLTKLAARLSDGNFPGALDAFSNTMPGYQDLAKNVDALTSQYDISCVIEIREESGDEKHRKADTEWFVQLKSKQEDGPTARRNTVVQLATERFGEKWKITLMEPQSLLAPPPIP